MPTKFIRSISTNEAAERYGWTQGEFTNIQNLAALKSDGTVISWGHHPYLPDENNGGIVKLYSHMYGYAGVKYDGTVLSWQHYFDVEKPDNLIDVNKIYSTREAFAALKNDGSVVTWGGMAIGENFGEDSSAVSSSLISGVKNIASTHGAFAALKEDGSVVTWGLSRDGGNSSTVADQLTSGVTNIFSTNYSFAALKENGSVVVWGWDKYGGKLDYHLGPWSSHINNVSNTNGDISSLQNGINKIYTISDGIFGATKKDGSVVVWGYGYAGVWLDHEDPDVIRFVEVSDQLNSNVINIFSTGNAAAALKNDGSVVTWGWKSRGGDSSAIASKLASDVVSISSTEYAFAALKDDGSVITWGDKTKGGDSSEISHLISSDVKKIYGGGDSFAALKNDGSVVSWGEYQEIQNMGSTFTSWKSVKNKLSNGVIDIVQNGQSDAWAALKDDGSVVTWGRNDYGGDSSLVHGPNGNRSADQLLSEVVALNNIATDEKITLFLIQPSSTNLNEGETLTTTVRTTNIASGTDIYWSLSGSNINSDDFVNGELEGVSKVDSDGKFSFEHTFLADGQNENTETLNIKLYSDSLRSTQLGLTKTLQINDNDTIPTIKGPTGSTGASSTISINENTTAVHKFTADESVRWTLVVGEDDDTSQLRIDTLNGELRFAFAPDYENAIDLNRDNKYIVKVRATDFTGNISDQSVSISIEDVDDTNPIIYGPSETLRNGSIQKEENEQTIFTFSANEDVNWSIVGGEDKSLFSIDNSTGMLSFNLPPDYEQPKDNDFNNDYVVTVRAVDYELNKSEFTLITYVKDVDEIKPSRSNSSENSGDDNSGNFISKSSADSSENSGDDNSGNFISGSLSDLEALKYIAGYSDLIEAFGIDTVSAISHYNTFGKSEGRSLSSFNVSDYLEKYSDLKTAFGSDETAALKHFIQHGYKEGRTYVLTVLDAKTEGSSNLTNFEVLNYLASYRDLIYAFGLDINSGRSHYTNHGQSEGRALDNFDEWGYLASNVDLMKAFGSDTTESVKHYISFGNHESRSFTSFDAKSYLNNYSDLRNAFGNDHKKATKHYAEFGFNEGRVY